MDDHQDFFECENCKNKDFKRVYNFSIRFHGVNFSDELIYDKLTNELYQCTKCSTTFSIEQIEEKITDFKKIRKAAG